MQPECHSLVEVQTPPPRFPSFYSFGPLSSPTALPNWSPTRVQQRHCLTGSPPWQTSCSPSSRKKAGASASLEGGRHKVETAENLETLPLLLQEWQKSRRRTQVNKESSLSYTSPFRPEVGENLNSETLCAASATVVHPCDGTHYQPTTESKTIIAGLPNDAVLRLHLPMQGSRSDPFMQGTQDPTCLEARTPKQEQHCNKFNKDF